MVSLVVLMSVARALAWSLLASLVSWFAKLHCKRGQAANAPAPVFATHPCRIEVWKCGTWTRATQKCTPLSMRRRDSGAHAPPKCKGRSSSFGRESQAGRGEREANTRWIAWIFAGQGEP